ncbi:YidH family protein [Nonomuraea salmonea]|uniref:YidH family protein n=1 Tax=Nonomuraea salmonea TaxID=46181 RepID=A0ABV5P259_9ACTN
MENTASAPVPAHNGTPTDAEPDVRFTFANERTFLAWSRTALALLIAGLAIVQVLPPFPGLPGARRMLAVPLIALGALLPGGAYLEWRRNQHAMRHGHRLPRSLLPRILVIIITAVALMAALVVLRGS